MNVEVILKAKGADVVTIEPSVTLSHAVNLLCAKKIGAVVVLDGTHVVGIMSERDVMRALEAAGAEALQMPVSQAMTRNVVTCTKADTIDDLMDTMTGERFRHLPVLDDGKLCGIISIGDVVKHRIAETEMEAEQLRSYIASG